jgi:hypothetical protein
VFEFPDQAAAENMAKDIMEALFAEAEIAVDQREAARLSGRSPLQTPTSRRNFLQGVFGGLTG